MNRVFEARMLFFHQKNLTLSAVLGQLKDGFFSFLDKTPTLAKRFTNIDLKDNQNFVYLTYP